MIESMAAGTPVIAMNLGSVPEVIAEGVSGYICNTVAECVEAVAKLPALSRTACREYVSHRFGVEQMAAGYEAVYQQILDEKFASNGHMVAANIY